ncbi:type II secretion system protein [Paenibacillus sp. F411]|uniref:type II secretion system protein n=1 Tax=Paenibacillus sp. F411 TaxID=2820239 RepID=UPI001AAFA338|nr:type II secretion system protein [Paenibacillus sp. F411]MBO2944815.1 type II secretion system protein [Paenibacillus sp. F411]
MLTKALKARQARLQGEKGFTLIELLAVIVILGIIAVIAIPLIGNIIDNSKEDSDVATARQLYDAARLYVIGEKAGDFANNLEVSLANLKSENYVDDNIALPSTKKLITDAKVTFDADGQLQSVSITPAPQGSAAGTYTADEVLQVDSTTTAPATP